MSAMVNAKETFKITVKFKEITDNEGITTGIHILPSDYEGDDASEMECQAIGRNWKDISLIKEESIIISHIKGTQLLRAYILYRLIIVKFFKSWNLVDADTNQALPITLDNIDRMHYLLVRTLVKKWLRATGGISSL